MGRINNQINDFISHWFGKIRVVKSKATDHNEFVARYKRFDQFIYHWRDSFSKEAILSNKEIIFSKYFGFGSHLDFIKRLIGQPASAFENPQYNIIVLLYTINISGHKVQFELHFHDKKLFSISYTYKAVNEEARKSILSSLLDKQGIGGGADLQNKIIIDQYGNGLLIDQGQTFAVHYLSPQSKVMQLAKEWSGMRVG
jgi:hypothetical protein